MLSKVETVYLYILRVLILAAATAALVALIVGIVGSVPLIMQLIPQTHRHLAAPASDLQTYISEKKSEGVNVSAQDVTPQSSNDVASIPSNVRDAEGLLLTYNRQRNHVELDSDQVEKVLMDLRADMPDEYQDAYGDSLDRLAHQLGRSTGRPLNVQQVDDLVHWHADKLKDAANRAITAQAAAKWTGMTSLAVAGGALVTFLLIVFCFLFVKIERNLRQVHVVEAKAIG